MSSASPYLQDAWVRWAHRGAFTRRDIEIVLGGFQTKNRVLTTLQKKIHEHRQDDLAQLRMAQGESTQRWDERLARLHTWVGTSDSLMLASGKLDSWLETAQWFDRAQTISEQLSKALSRKIESTEKTLRRVATRLQEWQDKLSLKEIELTDIVTRQTDQTGSILVSPVRKTAFLDFVFMEREEEGRLSLEFRKISTDLRQALHRLARPETWVLKKAAIYPAYMEIRKNQVFDQWRPLQQDLDRLSEEALQRGLVFEEGRKRLRGIYEKVQKMRVIEEAFVPPRPFLHRLFNLKDE